MNSRSRRAVLTLAGATLSTGLAGCLGDEDEEPQFLVTNALVAGTVGESGVRVRVTIENERSQRQTGTLAVTLRYDPPEGESQQWSKTEDISVGRGSSPRYEYTFADVYDSDNDIGDYTASGDIRNIEPDS